MTYTRDQVKDDLARRLENVKEAELVLSSKQRLLTNQTKALAVAMQALERTRSQKCAAREPDRRAGQPAQAAPGDGGGLERSRSTTASWRRASG